MLGGDADLAAELRAPHVKRLVVRAGEPARHPLEQRAAGVVRLASGRVEPIRDLGEVRRQLGVQLAQELLFLRVQPDVAEYFLEEPFHLA